MADDVEQVDEQTGRAVGKWLRGSLPWLMDRFWNYQQGKTRRRAFTVIVNVAAAAGTDSHVRVLGRFDRRWRVVFLSASGAVLAATRNVMVDLIMSVDNVSTVVSGAGNRSAFERCADFATLAADGNGGVWLITDAHHQFHLGVDSQEGENFLKVRVYDPASSGAGVKAHVLVVVEELV